jgi:hypothetical protein
MTWIRDVLDQTNPAKTSFDAQAVEVSLGEFLFPVMVISVPVPRLLGDGS